MSIEKKEKFCQICFNPIEHGEETSPCPKCKIPFHRECWDEYGGCSTYGCENAPEHSKEELPEEYAGAYWGQETKSCPYCSESIPINATRCPLCNEEFKEASPVSRQSIYKEKEAHSDPKEKETKNIILMFFIVSVLGCLAPFVMLFSVIWYYQNRQRIQQVPPVYHLLLAASTVFSIIYIIIFFSAILVGKFY